MILCTPESKIQGDWTLLVPDWNGITRTASELLHQGSEICGGGSEQGAWCLLRSSRSPFDWLRPTTFRGQRLITSTWCNWTAWIYDMRCTTGCNIGGIWESKGRCCLSMNIGLFIELHPITRRTSHSVTHGGSDGNLKLPVWHCIKPCYLVWKANKYKCKPRVIYILRRPSSVKVIVFTLDYSLGERQTGPLRPKRV